MRELHYVLGTLQASRFNFANELQLQDGIASVLRAAHVAFKREVVLSRGDRIDFLIDGHLGLEVKVDGGLNPVLRQLHRYAQLDVITSLLLVTTRMQHARIPSPINGKEVRVHHLLGSVL